jgi:hypothetical protein
MARPLSISGEHSNRLSAAVGNDQVSGSAAVQLSDITTRSRHWLSRQQ